MILERAGPGVISSDKCNRGLRVQYSMRLVRRVRRQKRETIIRIHVYPILHGAWLAIVSSEIYAHAAKGAQSNLAEEIQLACKCSQSFSVDKVYRFCCGVTRDCLLLWQVSWQFEATLV